MPAPTAPALLQAWEARAQPTGPAYAAHRPTLLAHLTAFCAHLRPDHDVNLDLEDLRSTLKPATGLSLATATASGPGRVAHLLQSLLADLTAQQALWPGTRPITSLLSLNSSADAELEMEEVTAITEGLRLGLLGEAEVVFGHGTLEEGAAGELRAWVVVGYAETVTQKLAKL